MVTGFGSGAYMASQLTHNYPDLIKGAAFISGGPWFMGAYEDEIQGGIYKARLDNLENEEFWNAFNGTENICETKSLDKF